MGDDRVTVTNLEIIKVDEKENIIFVKGAIPGAINGLILIKGAGDLKVNSQKLEEVKVEEVVAEEVKTEEVKVEDTKVEEVKTEDKIEEKVEEKKEA